MPILNRKYMYICTGNSATFAIKHFIMEKAFDFIRGLKPSFFELLGYPTIKVYSDYVEVYFDTSNTIRCLEVFNTSCSDEFRLFANDGMLTVCYTFYYNQ